MAEKQVLTPAGWLAQTKVRELPVGHVLDASDGRLREFDADGKLVADHGFLRAAPSGEPDSASEDGPPVP